MKLAFFSPWIPCYSGIAEYSFGLVEGLSKFFEIIVIHEKSIEEHVDALDGVKLISHLDPDLSNHIGDADLFIFQFGNNFDCHGYMIPYLEYNIPKLFHLHDIALGHFSGEEAVKQKGGKGYKDWLFIQYGENALVEYNFLAKTGDPLMTEFTLKYPMSGRFLSGMNSVIVHSNFAKKKIKEHLYPGPIYKVNQLYKLKEKEIVKKNKNFCFGIFGHVDPQKQVHLVIRLFIKLLSEKRNCSLHIYGKINPTYAEAHRFEFYENPFIDAGIYFHGFQSQESLNSQLAEVDAVIALRSPTMGETSAIVMKSLQLSKITVVSDTGWYSELTSPLILKISNTDIETQLEEKIKVLLEGDFDFPQSKNKADLNFEDMIQEYKKIILSVFSSCSSDKYNLFKERLNYYEDTYLEKKPTETDIF